MWMKKTIHSPAEMHQLWIELSKSENILFLVGNLWSGKTTFTKWFAEWLWIDPKKVQSPTYTYVNVYDEKLLHIDMYRLETFEDLIEKWIMDLINEYEYILIEWPKWTEKLNLGWTKTLTIIKTGDEEREIELL
jgi:tRNA threonylcarbamoyladenosine biosynthesis protein TsaE